MEVIILLGALIIMFFSYIVGYRCGQINTERKIDKDKVVIKETTIYPQFMRIDKKDVIPIWAKYEVRDEDADYFSEEMVHKFLNNKIMEQASKLVEYNTEHDYERNQIVITGKLNVLK